MWHRGCIVLSSAHRMRERPLEQDDIEIRSKFMETRGVDTVFEHVDLIPLTPRRKYRFLIRSTQP